MSNNMDDDEMKAHADRFHREIKKMQEENARKEQARLDWQKDSDPRKPDAESFNKMNGGPPMTEEAMVRAAKERADQGLIEDRKLKAAHIAEEQERRKKLEEERERNRLEVEKRLKEAKAQRDQKKQKMSRKM